MYCDSVLWLYLTVSCNGLQYVIVESPGPAHFTLSCRGPYQTQIQEDLLRYYVLIIHISSRVNMLSRVDALHVMGILVAKLFRRTHFKSGL